MACRARRPYKLYRSRRFGTDATPPVRPSATPRRRRQLRVERGCRGLWCLRLLPRGGCFNPAFSISAHAVMSRPTFAFARHPGAGRDPVTSVHVVATTRRSCYWIPACAGMTVRGTERLASSGAVRPRWSRRRAATCSSPSLASVNGDGAVWPSVEQEVSCLFPTPRPTGLVGSAGSTGHFSWFLLFGPAKRRDSGAGRRPKARRRRATSRFSQP
jgi:hypothetical protein